MNTYLIIGLGNPDTQYLKTRHNVGWILMDHMFPNVDWRKNTYAHANVAHVNFQDSHNIQLVKPNTFMNESGKVTDYFTEKENYHAENIIVIYDDLDLLLGAFKISFDRGSGGHNGIKSLEHHLGTSAFIRIRIGIAKKIDQEIIKPNVLGNFESEEQEILITVAQNVKKAIATILSEGKEKAMTHFN